MNRCGTCAHLIARPDRDGKIRVRAANPYHCGAPVPDVTPMMPWSVTHAYGYYPQSDKTKCRVLPEDGAECPTFQKRA